MLGGALIEIRIVPESGVPATIAEKAVAHAKRKVRDSFSVQDEVWAVFDRDEHPNFDFAVNRCREGKVRVARSNPCFELWLLLHRTDFDRPDNRFDVQSALRRHCPEYNPSRGKLVDCVILLNTLTDAEQRAATLLRRRADEGDDMGAPSTTVHELTRAIRKAAEAFRPR